MTNFQWVTSVKRYRNTDTGRFMSGKQVVQLRDELIAGVSLRISLLSDDLADGYVGVDEWLQDMREHVKTLTTTEFMFGRGGKNAATEEDRRFIEALVQTQYSYLQGFANEVAAGRLSPEQMRARSNLYARAGVAAHGAGQAAAWGFELEQYPGDGQTRCLVNCKCHLEVREMLDVWEVRWVTNPAAEHCEDCQRMAREWNPLKITKGA